MKIKLFYKIFATFLLTAFMIVALMVGFIRFYVARNFTDYVNSAALERLGELKDELAEVYRQHQGWHPLKDNRARWEEILRSAIPRRDFSRSRPSSEVSDDRRREGDRSVQDRLPPTSRERLHRFARGLALFDAQRQKVVGARPGLSAESFTLAEINVDGKTVGWLGLYKREHLANPLVVAFLKQQSRALYLIGIPILLLAAIVAFLLSRHFLAPIRQLTAGTRALSSRQFDTRIEVQSQDELGQLARDFNMMAQTLAKYEKMRQQWISDISHELRTPLSVLRGELEAIQDGVHKMDRETLNSLHTEVLHVTKIVNDLHDLALADTGSLSFKKEPIDPLLVLADILRVFRARFERQAIKLQEELASEAPVRIRGDADRLAQLFSNLLENTLRYANSPGTLKLWHHCSANQITLYFEDSGPGVPPASLEHLFDRLYRVDKSRSRALGGSGLGLSICKSIVETLGGQIRAVNAPSGGLRIEIVLPLFMG
ncbi:MAG: HAMP domain-containing protein [Desulfobacterales bacterium]|nr:MAG: HAMP domain-containing protein [Desulfobacterales bacterium]